MEHYLSALVERARSGDEQAFKELYSRLFPLVRKIVISRIDEKDWEDAIQISFIAIFNKISSYRGDAPFENWCSTLARNAVSSFIIKNYVRRKKILDQLKAIFWCRTPERESSVEAETGTDAPDEKEEPSPPTEQVSWVTGAAPSSLDNELSDSHRKAVEVALAQLPYKFSVLLTLTFWEKKSTSEIGNILGESKKTIQSRLKRARCEFEKLFAKALKKYEE